MTKEDLEAKFPSGKYWNHVVGAANNPNGWTSTPCSHHGSCSKGGTDYSGWCGCNSFQGGSIQCFGFAYQLGYDAYGYSPGSWGKSSLTNLKPGDIIRYKNNTHSIFVTGVDGNTITYADCNSDGHCLIRWNVTISKATVSSTLNYVFAAPYELPNGGVHVHSYTSSNYEAAHPHRIYEICSCGATRYTGETKGAIAGCASCSFNQDSKYGGVKGFKAYPCTGANFEVKTATFSITINNPASTDAAEISAEQVKAKAGDTVAVRISVNKNPGMMYLKLGVLYDVDVLELTGVENGGIMDSIANTSSTIQLDSGKDETANGTLATLTFKVKEEAQAGTYPVRVVLKECYNLSEQDINVHTVEGAAEISGNMDCNGDGTVDGKDLIRLRKYLAAYDESTGTSSVVLGS